VDFEIDGADLDLEKLAHLAPQALARYREITHQHGYFHLNTRISGEYDDKNFPVVQGEFGMSNGRLTPRSLGYSLSKFTINGNFDNGASKSLHDAQLRVPELSFYLHGEKTELQFTIDNFNVPVLDMKGKIVVDLKVFKDILAPQITGPEGNLQFNNLVIKGPIENLKTGKLTPETLVQGELVMENLSFTKGRSAIKNISGKINISPTQWQTEDLLVQTAKSDLTIKDYLLNASEYLTQYLFRDTAAMRLPLSINIAIQSAHCDIKDIAGLFATPTPADTSAKVADHPIKAPVKSHLITGEVDLTIDRLSYEKVDLRNLQGRLSINDEFFLIHPLELEGFGGKGWLQGKYKRDEENNLHTWTYIHFEGLQIDELMRQFENFGQNILPIKTSRAGSRPMP